MKPFDQICGDYFLYITGVGIAPATPGSFPSLATSKHYATMKMYQALNLPRVPFNDAQYIVVGKVYDVTTVLYFAYRIPCNDPCFLGGNFPSDAFTGNGAGQGPFVDGNGNLYDPYIPSDPKQPRKLVAVGISPDTASVSVGGTTSFTGTAYYVNGPGPYTSDITNLITSGNSAVATIANGLVTGVSQGQAVLRVTFGGYSAVSVVDVGNASGPKTLTNITINPPTQTVYVGQTASFSAIAHYSDGSTQDVTANSATLWSTQISGFPNTNPPGTAVAYTAPVTTTSGNKNMPSGLSVPSGLSSPTQPGIFTSAVQTVMTIIAEYTEGGVKKSAQATATFDKKSIQITPLQATIYIHHANPDKKQQQFIAKDGNGTDVTQQLSWDTSDATIANVSNFDIHKGLAFAGNKAGTVKISATDIPTGIKSDPDAELSVMCWQHTFYSQNDSRWKDNIYAYHQTPWLEPNVNTTIGDVGCSMATYSMVLATSTDYIIFKPDSLNQLMTDLELYEHDTNYTQRKALVLLGNGVIKSAISTDYSEAWIDELKKCNMILAHLRSSHVLDNSIKNKQSNGHYVLLVSYSPLPNGGGYFLAYDPWRDGTGWRTIDPLDIINDGGSTLITF